MSITASNNVFPHDPDDNFLEKGGYVGTAKDLDDAIKELAFPDGFLKTTPLTKTGNNISIDPLDFKWRINQVEYVNPALFTRTINPATEGYNRIDILVATIYSVFVLIEGEESIDSALEPDTPEGTLKAAFISVFGGDIVHVSEPTNPVANGVYVSKAESFFQAVTETGVVNTLDLSNINTGLSFNNAATELHTLYVAIPFMLYPRRPLYIKNNQLTDLKIKHLGTGTGTYKFSFPNAQDFILKPGEMIMFKLLFSGSNPDSSYNNNSNIGTYEYVGASTVDLSNYYNKTEIDTKISSVLIYKGSVANYAALPSTGLTIGDVYNLTNSGHNYAWSGSDWDDLGPAVDVSGKEDTSNKTNTITGNETSTSLYASIKGIVDWLTSAKIKSILGISTLSGSNTGDETTSTLKTKIDVELAYALSDETSNLTVGNLISFRVPFAIILSEIRISVNDAPTVSSLIVDVKEAGVSIFSTLLSIDATELTSVTAATPAVISDVNLADDALITVSTTQIGSGNSGKGLKILFKGKKS
jgi:hypothetical protein